MDKKNGRRPGRPRGDPRQVHRQRHIAVCDELWDRVEALSVARGCSVSELVRLALEAQLRAPDRPVGRLHVPS